MNGVRLWWILIWGEILICPCSFAQETAASPANLADAAYTTYVNYNRAFQAGNERTVQKQGETEIPSKYWEKQIKAQRPIRVYLHRVNVVVVQRLQNNVEEGKYIHLPISSYLPKTGDDGFEFKPIPLQRSVFEYKRARSE